MLTNDKIDKYDIIIRLHPTRFVIERTGNAANMLPSAPIATIHEVSSTDSGPVVSGVSFDFSSGSTGATHDTMHPCENTIKFAIMEVDVNHALESFVKKNNSFFDRTLTCKDSIILIAHMANVVI